MSKDRLFNLADVYYGKSPNGFRSESETKYKMYGTGGVVGYSTKPLFASSGVVIPRKGSLNNPSYTTGEYWVIDTAYAAIPKEGIDAKWLYYQLVNFDLSSLNEATGVPSISRDLLYKTELFKTSYEEQQRIVVILSSVDRRIELTQKLIEKKKLIKTGLFHTFLSSLTAIDRELGKFCRIEIGGTPSRANEDYWSSENTGSPWVSIADLKANIIYSTKESITEKAIYSSNVKLLKAGTLMMSFKLTLGKVAIAGTDLYTNEAIAAMYPDASCRSLWLYYLLPYVVQNSISETAVKGATLNKQSMAKLMVPIPDIQDQDKFIELMSICDGDLEKEILLLSKLKAQKQGLMQDLLTGQVRVN
ncbi:restriction endonuclease subunit S [Polynucleobacter sp. MWH-Mekk-B1]|uniref:restriction endonuclease subunit S n=1 Tax=Polynucleobacter finlandensis TaxID=1855894 RepID=UPI001C0C25A9|nr:restriction endonuclease subunit S [Polynucleobacter finlandensis]MBU3545460.1 restriction endonuclease subunit S [Polynucleobacter finlandensis]